MTIFDSIKNKNIDELVEWLDKYGQHDGSPWYEYWNESYCNKCKPEMGRIPELDRDLEFAWCELHNKCRFFQNIDDIPDSKQIIKMWLESEEKYENY